ncbi:MAG: hypothetical protein AAGE03_11015 [Pseudomonadota bacterium]
MRVEAFKARLSRSLEPLAKTPLCAALLAVLPDLSAEAVPAT